MEKNLCPQIIELRNKGFSYNKISQELNCSKSVICYHLGENQKSKNKSRSIKNRANHLLSQKVFDYVNKGCKELKQKSNIEKTFVEKLNIKIQKFNVLDRKGIIMKGKFGVEELKNRINDVKCCELSGRAIDIQDTGSWHLDHKIPVSRGGDNSIENVAILKKEINYAKHNMTNEEFIQMCKDVLIFNGYKVK